jgi:hypothetical protein
MDAFGAAVIAGVVAVVVGINHINAKHEKNKKSKESDGPSSESLVEAAWDEFGGDEPPALLRRRVDRLAKDVKLSELGSKTPVIQFAIMATRADRNDLLPLLADRAESLDAGCGETRTLRALAEAHTGTDRAKVLEAIESAQSAVEGCAKCSSSIESKILAEELMIAADNVDERFAQEEAARRPSGTPQASVQVRRSAPETVETQSTHGNLSVRVVRR